MTLRNSSHQRSELCPPSTNTGCCPESITYKHVALTYLNDFDCFQKLTSTAIIQCYKYATTNNCCAFSALMLLVRRHGTNHLKDSIPCAKFTKYRLSCDNARITIDFVRCASLAKSSDHLRKSKLPYSFPKRNISHIVRHYKVMIILLQL